MFWFLGYKKWIQWIYLSLFSGFKTGLKVYQDLIDVSDWFEGSGGGEGKDTRGSVNMKTHGY